ncbi:uncharacterized protein LOC110382864 [Helicoverpa armigera]|uniref:uncharacterized protein LOC110382864 n=1 Tax=Helicoverpa armigera TaxID=29058 RepID=UPI003082881F
MWENMFIFLFIFHLFCFGLCGYPPIGDEVQAGSVLLPASRRGRYLANIVRRQAVDGTGIKFNKDADRMNAEAKKKVDVLSEELLPYIIAEQERRTTLYKRVMTAIQNGEKGVTIAEIRNKPPAIIRKGLMYRCPTNRAPKEPDGSGVIMCEDDIDPRPIMYDSCLSAEDKELYVAENRYFFCNRHKIEGPDPPRNGTAVIGCAPCERTSLNYTSMKCALEDTDDVVVHYRYYPDRTYKFVSELDPDREVCEHWNPCQIGYIFSLPGPDQATLATELWQDDRNETWLPAQAYETSARKVVIPDGYNYEGVGRWESTGKKRVSIGAEMLVNLICFQMPHILVINEVVGNNSVKIKIKFNPLKMSDARTYYARMAHKERPHKEKKFYIPLVTINFGRTHMNPQVLHVLPGQKLNTTSISFTCDKCTVTGVMVRGDDDSVSNLDGAQYRVRKYNDEQSIIEIDFDEVQPKFFGDYFLMIQNEDGSEEKVRALTVIRKFLFYFQLAKKHGLFLTMAKIIE